jgi:hypothetical protein
LWTCQALTVDNSADRTDGKERSSTAHWTQWDPVSSPRVIKHENQKSVARRNIRNRTNRLSRPCAGLERAVICTAPWKAKKGSQGVPARDSALQLDVRRRFFGLIRTDSTKPTAMGLFPRAVSLDCCSCRDCSNGRIHQRRPDTGCCRPSLDRKTYRSFTHLAASGSAMDAGRAKRRHPGDRPSHLLMTSQHWLLEHGDVHGHAIYGVLFAASAESIC